MGFCSLFPGFFAVATLLLFAGELTLQPLEFLLRFTIVAWIVYRLPVRIGRIGFESHINPNLSTRWNVFDMSLCLHAELSIVAVSASDNAYPFDSLDGECSNLLFRITHQSQATDPTAIGEEDMLSIRLKFPACLLVLD